MILVFYCVNWSQQQINRKSVGFKVCFFKENFFNDSGGVCVGYRMGFNGDFQKFSYQIIFRNCYVMLVVGQRMVVQLQIVFLGSVDYEYEIVGVFFFRVFGCGKCVVCSILFNGWDN